MSMFKRAERKRVFLKIGLMGASGSGKSRSALELAKGLADGGQIAAIDTENGSLSLYSHVAEFDVADVSAPFDPQKYIDVIRGAEEAGYKVLIIDSFSHAWKYLLDKKESLDRRGGSQNKYTNWGPVKQEAERLKDAILQSRMHVICCMRAKTEYAQENGKVTKLGMAAIQEPDAEYEFTTVFQIDMAHNATQSKDRTGLFMDRIFRIDPNTGKTFLNWLESAESQEYAENPISAEDRLKMASAWMKDALFMDGAMRKDFAAAVGQEWPAVALEAKKAGIATADGLLDFATPVNEEAEAATAEADMESQAQGEHEAREAAMAGDR